ncbi:MAG: DNA replication/repair protein RecF [Acidimicrobiales bacterium]
MYFEHLWLKDFRNYIDAELVPARSGITVLAGDNGSGKTNFLEAVGYLATGKSFRGAAPEAMVRSGAERAVVRGQAFREARAVLIEAEIAAKGRDRLQVNRQPLRRSGDLRDVIAVTVFSPDDLQLVKGGPQGRRDYLDELLAVLQPRYVALLNDMERALRQRNVLLKTAGGALRGNMGAMLEIWDGQFSNAGEAVASARAELVVALAPEVQRAYWQMCGVSEGDSTREVRLAYLRSWQGDLLRALALAREEDLRRGVTTLGPQRDELVLVLGGLPARTHASQGEQRSLALALRLGGYRLVSARAGSLPVLLLDDVFSELDAQHCAALASNLPSGQALITAAGPLPVGLEFARRVEIKAGAVRLCDGGG